MLRETLATGLMLLADFDDTLNPYFKRRMGWSGRTIMGAEISLSLLDWVSPD
jgi:hypothetical protein